MRFSAASALTCVLFALRAALSAALSTGSFRRRRRIGSPFSSSSSSDSELEPESDASESESDPSASASPDDPLASLLFLLFLLSSLRLAEALVVVAMPAHPSPSASCFARRILGVVSTPERSFFMPVMLW